jgi:hypothetical protein
MKNVDDDGDVEVFVVCELAHLMFFEYPGHDVRTVEWRRVIIPITMNRGSYIRVFAADLDGGGYPEVVAANKGEQNPDVHAPRLSNLSLYLVPPDPLNGMMGREQLPDQVHIPINREPVDLDGDGDLDAVGTRSNSAPYDGVIWLEQVRQDEPQAVFVEARAIDSQQMPPPDSER